MIPLVVSHGWLCPSCGKAHAPSVLTCPNELRTYATTGVAVICEHDVNQSECWYCRAKFSESSGPRDGGAT